MRIGVIGYGYWGPNLVRNFAELNGVEVTWCADVRPERLALVGRRYPSIRLATEAREILDDDAVDAVAIATPVSTHHALAKAALERDKHVLVEKPPSRDPSGQERPAVPSLSDHPRRALIRDLI